MEELTQQMVAFVEEILEEEEWSDEHIVDELYQRYQLTSMVLMQAVVQYVKDTDRDPSACIQNYVEEVVPRYTDVQFREHFRMGREVFEKLCQFLAPHLQTSRTISVEKKILCTLWLLGNNDAYRQVAHMFGMDKGSLRRIVKHVCKTLTMLRNELFPWPTTHRQYQKLADDYAICANFPGVIGAVDGTHIPVLKPSINQDKFINRKHYASYQLQVVCDKQLKFLDVYSGWPGSVHDSRVFNNSSVKTKVEDGRLPSNFHLLGDSAYALSPYMMTPFRDNGHLTPLEIKYNLAHSQTRIHVERSIGLLKGKFRRLKMLEMTKPKDIMYFLFAACALHNFILFQGPPDLDHIEDANEERDNMVDAEGNSPEGMDKRLGIAINLM